MGHWSVSCSLTGLPIIGGDEIYAMPVHKSRGLREGWRCLGGIYRGEYDEYGGIENITANGLTSTLSQLLTDRGLAEAAFADSSFELPTRLEEPSESIIIHTLFFHRAAVDNFISNFSEALKDKDNYFEWSETNLRAFYTRTLESLSVYALAAAKEAKEESDLSEKDQVAKIVSSIGNGVFGFAGDFSILFDFDLAAALSFFNSKEGWDNFVLTDKLIHGLRAIGHDLSPRGYTFQDPVYGINKIIVDATSEQLDSLLEARRG